MSRLTLACALFFLLSASWVSGQDNTARSRYSLERIIDLHANDVACPRLTTLIRTNGVNFEVTDEILRKLKAARNSEKEVICEAVIQEAILKGKEFAREKDAENEKKIAGHLTKATAGLDQGRYSEAMAELQNARAVNPTNKEVLAALEKARMGAEAEKSIAQNERLSLANIERVLTALTPKRLAALVGERGIYCTASQAETEKLKRAGADDQLIVMVEKKSLDNEREIARSRQSARSGLEQGKYTEAIREIEKNIALCPTAKQTLAAREHAQSAQKSEDTLKPGPLELSEIDRLLKGHVTSKRVASLVKERKLGFTTFTEDDEKKLSASGDNDEVIAAIRVILPAATLPPPSPGRVTPTPEAAIVLVNQGRASYQQGNPNLSDVLRTAEEALKLDPNYKDAWVLKGDALRALKRFKDALESFNKAVALNTNDATSLAKRGQVHLDLSQYEEALRDLDRASKLNPAPPTTWILRGDSLAALKRCTDAKESYQKARERDPKGNFHLPLTDRENRLNDCGK